MNKADLIEAVAKETGSTKTASGAAVDAVLKALSGSLAKGETVQLIGFGSFAVVKTKARKGRNPRTGDTIKIPAGKRVKFVAGSKLKTRVAKGK
mgnify:CR=1 FL=1